MRYFARLIKIDNLYKKSNFNLHVQLILINLIKSLKKEKKNSSDHVTLFVHIIFIDNFVINIREIFV